MEKNRLIELRKRLMALGTIGALGLTGVTGCNEKIVRNSSCYKCNCCIFNK